MKIKKDIYHVIFFDSFFELISIVLVTLGFFLGFEVTKTNILIYLLIIGIIILLGVIVFCLYFLFCKTYYEFANDSLKIKRKGNIIKEINYNKIKCCEYYRFVTLLLGDSKGGKLLVYYLEDEIEKNIEISFLKKLTKKINIKNIFIK
ncbi:MAG: hypothetical protein J6C23_09205 [Clostridia bacterium]|nr:hypothetical protein [Clostridia bacterium]